jgi:glycosyltransferase involved in cell wall biosynthesis
MTSAVRSEPRTLSTLQIGMQWFPERGGGLDRVYYDMVRMLPAAGVQFTGLVAGSERVAADSGGSVRAFAPSDVSLMKRWRGVRAAVQSQLAAGRFDLVVSHFALYTFPVRGVIAQHRLPLVVHFQGPWAAESREEGAGRAAVWAKASIERQVYARAQRFIVLSDPFGKILTNTYGMREELIRRVPPGLETARFRTGLSRAEAREKLGWPLDRPIVITVRRLAHRMGLEDLVDAAAAVRKAVPDVLFLIAGRGRLSGALEERIKKLDLARHVRLLGFVADEQLPLAYTAADLTAVPTIALEGFGLVVVESLAAGTPVIVTPVGGLPDGIVGLAPQLVLPGTGAAAVAEGVTAALRGRLPLPSREQCEQHAEANFDWNAIAKKMRAVYQEVLT